ncbi:DUF2946 domain-containing protein [Rhodopseudomonas telluris]|uniref:DUF2946 domain-containing protein n=1 Tax=Rhodopseudomonas telluris TaxID=644215 RepID=A0ABV6EQN6_9BRAD
MQLRRVLPVFFVALWVQIFAPIGVYFAEAGERTSGLFTTAICHADDASTDQGSQPGRAAAPCVLCCLAAVTGPIDTPLFSVQAMPPRSFARVVWREQTPARTQGRGSSGTQARAPPTFS